MGIHIWKMETVHYPLERIGKSQTWAQEKQQSFEKEKQIRQLQNKTNACEISECEY